MRISDWSSDVCSSDLCGGLGRGSRPCGGGSLGLEASLLGGLLLSLACKRTVEASAQLVDAGVDGGEELGHILGDSGNQRDRQRVDSLEALRRSLQRRGVDRRVGLADELGRASGRERVCQYV